MEPPQLIRGGPCRLILTETQRSCDECMTQGLSELARVGLATLKKPLTSLNLARTPSSPRKELPSHTSIIICAKHEQLVHEACALNRQHRHAMHVPRNMVLIASTAPVAQMQQPEISTA